MTEALHLRDATPDDTTLILEMIRELADYERGLDRVEATAEALHDALFGSRPAAEAVIAEWDGQPAGFALFFHNFSTWTGRRGIYLEDLYVRPEVRGHGIGRALLTHLARLAVERDCGRLEWVVLDWNEPAIGFYRSLAAHSLDEWTIFRLDGEALKSLAGHAEPGQKPPAA